MQKSKRHKTRIHVRLRFKERIKADKYDVKVYEIYSKSNSVCRCPPKPKQYPGFRYYHFI